MSEVAIVGIGLHPFGRTDGVSGREQGAFAARAALADAGIEWPQVEVAFGGSSSSGSADTLVNELGLTGLPFINVANGCATGGSALVSAYSAIKSGMYDVAMAIGFDKHPHGAFAVNTAAMGLGDWYGEVGLALTTQFFGMKIQRYMHLHGVTEDALIRVAEKNYYNGSLNPNAWRRTPLTYDEIKNSPMVNDPLRKYMFCSPSEGGAALILASAKAARRFTTKPVWLKAASIRTRLYGSFEVLSPDKAIVDAPSPTVQASEAAYAMAGIGPQDMDIAQIQDTESGAEIMHMAENGFCADGDQERMLADRETWISGRLPINTDGGCIANGEPIGASGLRQVYENCLQIRGAAGVRQVQKPVKAAYTHVYGAPGLSAVTILST